jgi:hypothetical protein
MPMQRARRSITSTGIVSSIVTVTTSTVRHHHRHTLEVAEA